MHGYTVTDKYGIVSVHLRQNGLDIYMDTWHSIKFFAHCLRHSVRWESSSLLCHLENI